MIGEAYLLFVIAGTAYAAYLDLRTGEVPDLVSLVVAGGGILYHAGQSIVAGSVEPLAGSLFAGTVLFIAGWILYRAGAWGGADAFVLGAVGYALPRLPAGAGSVHAPWPFPVSLVLTVLLVGAVYSMGYAILIGLRSQAVMEAFWEDIRDSGRWFAAIIAAYVAISAVGGLFLSQRVGVSVSAVLFRMIPFSLVFVALLALNRYMRAVEDYGMRSAVPVDELQIGDVLAEEVDLEASGQTDTDPVERVTDRMAAAIDRVSPVSLPQVSDRAGTRVVGITEEERDELQDRFETVEVKRGVRFIVAFPVAIAILVLYGDPFMLAIASAT